MKQDTLNTVMVRLILTTGLLLLFTWGANAAEPGAMKGIGQMKGFIEAGEKSIALLAVGDRVKLKLKNPEAVMPGDRMDIYEPAKTGMVDDRGDELLAWVGRLVITGIDGGTVLGSLESATREIFAGSHLDYTLPDERRQSRYFGLMRMMAASMADPARNFVTVALPDVTDGAGNETRLSEAVYVQLREALCGRPQFRCVERGALRAMLDEYDVKTGASAGGLVRGKAATRFAADWFVTGRLASADALNAAARENVRSGGLFLTVTAYDLRSAAKVFTSTYPVAAGEYNIANGATDDVLVAYRAARHAYLKIMVDGGAMLSGRRVDNLFMAPLDEYVDMEHRRHISGGSDGRVIMGNIEVSLDGKPLRRGADGVYYDDIVSAGGHTLRVSAVPSLMGRGEPPIGKRLDKSVQLIIAPDAAYTSQVLVGIFGRQGLIAVDTRPMREHSFGGVLADGR